MGATSSTALGKKSSARQVVDLYAGGNATFLSGKLAVVTGGNSGIGCETVKALASAGCRVIMASRSLQAGEDAIAKEIEHDGQGGYTVPNARSLIEVRQLDLASLASVKAFAAGLASEPHIDFLVGNAGVMAIPQREETVDGFEKQIGTNHFGHWYLISLLRAKLVSQNTPVRIVLVSSDAHRESFSALSKAADTQDLHFTGARKYSAWGAYGQSKLANILCAKSLADQLKDTKVVVVSLHPGIIATNLQRSLNGCLKGIVNNFLSDKTIPQGAATTLFACLDPSLDSPALRGSYLSDCAVATPSKPAQDPELRVALWDVTNRQVAEAAAKLE